MAILVCKIGKVTLGSDNKYYVTLTHARALNFPSMTFASYDDLPKSVKLFMRSKSPSKQSTLTGEVI